MGWQVREPYVNGGVIWYSGTNITCHFADTWHQNWLINVDQTGRYRDQTSLNYTLASNADLNLVLLSHHWNSQYACRADFVKNAIIWHTHASHADRPLDLFSMSHQKLQPNAALKPESPLITRLTKAHSPWPICNRINARDHIQIKLKKLGALSTWVKLWEKVSPRYQSKQQKNQGDSKTPIRLLAIGHEASLTGAPLLLLSYLRTLNAKSSGIDYRILLARGGHLLNDYQSCGDTFVDGPISNTSELSTFHIYIGLRTLLNIDVLGWLLSRWLNQHSRLDVIYVNTVASVSALNRVLKRLANKPAVVIHVHELDFLLEKYNLDGSTSAALHHATKIIAPSRSVANAIQRLFRIPKEKIEIINEWIIKRRNNNDAGNAQRRLIRRSLGIPETATLCIGTGRMQWRKGSDLLALLTKHCMDHSRSIHVGWIGQGGWDDVEQLKIEATKLGSRNNLHLLDEQVDPYPYYAAADIFILPSREDPYPVAMLEAALFKLPIVCFEQSGGASDFISIGAGIAVPHMNITSFASAIYRLSSQPALREEMGNKGAAAIHKNHLIEHAEIKITRLLREAARKTRALESA